MTQNYGEKASEFLSRARKQIATAKVVGYTTFDNEEMVGCIILDGLSTNIKLYSATLAEKKATFLKNPTEITLTSLEKT